MTRIIRKHWCSICHAWTNHLVSIFNGNEYTLCGRCHSGRYL
jgi:hypothetical protein